MNIIDKFPVAVQHALIALAVALLTWGGTVLPAHLPIPIAGIVGAAITILVGWLTPLTTQYGLKYGKTA